MTEHLSLPVWGVGEWKVSEMGQKVSRGGAGWQDDEPAWNPDKIRWTDIAKYMQSQRLGRVTDTNVQVDIEDEFAAWAKQHDAADNWDLPEDAFAQWWKDIGKRDYADDVKAIKANATYDIMLALQRGVPPNQLAARFDVSELRQMADELTHRAHSMGSQGSDDAYDWNEAERGQWKDKIAVALRIASGKAIKLQDWINDDQIEIMNVILNRPQTVDEISTQTRYGRAATEQDLNLLREGGLAMLTRDGRWQATNRGKQLMYQQGHNKSLPELIASELREMKADQGRINGIGLKPSKVVLINDITRKRIPGTPEFNSKAEAIRWVESNPIPGYRDYIGTFYGTDQDY